MSKRYTVEVIIRVDAEDDHEAAQDVLCKIGHCYDSVEIVCAPYCEDE